MCVVDILLRENYYIVSVILRIYYVCDNIVQGYNHYMCVRVEDRVRLFFCYFFFLNERSKCFLFVLSYI